MRNLTPIVLVGAALVAASGCSMHRPIPAAQRLHGRPAPDIALASIDGETVRLSSLRGRPVIVAFFATW